VSAQIAGKCSDCGKEGDPLGYHYLSCGSGAQRIFRHDILKTSFKDICGQAGVPAVLEQLLGTLNFRDVGEMRMDVVAVLEGRTELYDITVHNPVCPSNVGAASRHPGVTAANAEKQKINTYSCVKPQGGIFIPIAAEVFGRWGEETSTLLARLAEFKLTRMGLEGNKVLRSRLINKWWNVLACTLVKSNVFMILSKTHNSKVSTKLSSNVGECLLPDFRANHVVFHGTGRDVLHVRA
jgi:hypothetical protein